MTDWDAIVIGAGAGGGACAFGLANQGLRVLVLESGPAYRPETDYGLDQPDWEQSRFPYPASSEKTYGFATLQPLSRRWQSLRSWSHIRGAMNAGNRRAGRGYYHVRGVGGSTLHFTGEAHRLHPAAMKMKTDHGVGADWPITYDELEPYYVRAEQIVGVAGPAEAGARPRSRPLPLPPHPLSFASQKLGEGFQRLGLGWGANTLAVLSKPYDGRPGCNYCANCNRGCPRRDKGSVDVTFIPKAVATGRCQVQSGCEVFLLEAGARDTVTAVHYLDENGTSHKISAPAIVVAGGAIHTPRLLLASVNPHAPEGLCNDSGQVGRNLMETIFAANVGLHPEALGSHRGHPSDAICWDFNAPDAIPGVIGGCRFTPATAEADLVGPISYAQRVVKGWGVAHKQKMRTAFGRALAVVGLGESLPNARTFVDLDPQHTTRAGLPRARIHSWLEEDAFERMRFMRTKCREVLEAAGVSEMIEEETAYDQFSSTHVFGTCRMGNDPESSVVDAHGRSHRWKNLYIADASVFPSSGGGESPSLTIEALALRTADHIARRLQRKEAG